MFSEAYWKDRDFEASTLEPPLGSGPYKVGRFEQGRFIEFDRVPDYWGKDLPVNVGTNNFDRVRYEYFRDRQVAFEAFKSGVMNFHEEFTSRIWATGYDFPAFREGRVKRERIDRPAPSATQGWYFNTRRENFQDRAHPRGARASPSTSSGRTRTSCSACTSGSTPISRTRR